jgi:hypothetical protein
MQAKSSLELLQAKNFGKSAVREYARETTLNLERGLQLIEAYRLLLSSEEISKLPLQPLAVGVLLEEIAHELSPYANQYDTKLQTSVQHRLAPVLVHGPSLRSALEVLSSSLIRAQSAQGDKKSYEILLGAHRMGDNSIATGVFSTVHGLSDKTLRAARSLVGKARQPLPALPPGAAAGVLVADMLCASMWQPLRSAAHNNLTGLATNIPASRQLNFV